jgi:hypothetical protein
MTYARKAQHKAGNYFGFQLVQNLKQRNMRGTYCYNFRLLLSFHTNIIGCVKQSL